MKSRGWAEEDTSLIQSVSLRWRNFQARVRGGRSIYLDDNVRTDFHSSHDESVFV